MIEIRLKIKEEINKELSESKVSFCGVEVETVMKNATEGEKKTSKIINERLKMNQKVQFENLSKKKSNEEVLKELIEELF